MAASETLDATAAASKPGVGDVLGAIVNQIGYGPFLLGLAAVCAVLAYNIFAARAASALLARIEAGAEPVTGGRSGRVFFLNAAGKRVYRPDMSDTDAVKDWYNRLADNRAAYTARQDGSAARAERRANLESYYERRSASYRRRFGDEVSVTHRDTNSDVHRDYDD